MTSKFDIAFDYVIKNEGTDISIDSTDKGGVTKFGISSRFINLLKKQEYLPSKNVFVNGVSAGRLQSNNIVNDYINDLTIDLAKLIYQQYFWLPIYEKIENPDICNYIFDMHVQHGEYKSAELVQRAINAYNRNQRLKIDGIFGKETFLCLSCFFNDRDFRACLIAVRESLFRCIVAHDKTQENKLEGWLKRCYR